MSDNITQGKENLTTADAMKLLDEVMSLPHMKKVMIARAREDKEFTIGGPYYNEKVAVSFVQPIADAMIKYAEENPTKTCDVELPFQAYEGIMAPHTIYLKLMQGSKFLSDVGHEKYAAWRANIRICKRADRVLVKVIKPIGSREIDKPIFNFVEQEEKGNEWKDLYEWLELEAPASTDEDDLKKFKLYLKQKINLSPEDIQSLNNLFDSMPQFTARIKHNEIKVIRESIIDENTNA